MKRPLKSGLVATKRKKKLQRPKEALCGSLAKCFQKQTPVSFVNQVTAFCRDVVM